MTSHELWTIAACAALCGCGANDGELGGGFDPDDEVSGIEGGNARPGASGGGDGFGADGGDGEGGDEDGGQDAGAGEGGGEADPLTDRSTHALLIAGRDGSLTLQPPARAAPRAVLLPAGSLTPAAQFRPVVSGDRVAVAADRDGDLVIVDGTGRIHERWRPLDCPAGLSRPVALPTSDRFALTEDRSSCGDGRRLHLLGDSRGVRSFDVPEDLSLIAEAADGASVLYSQPGEVGRLVLDSGDRKPALIAADGAQIRAAVASPDGAAVIVWIEEGADSRLVRLDPLSGASGVEHETDLPAATDDGTLVVLASGVPVIAGADDVRFYLRPKAPAFVRQAGEGALLAVSVMPSGDRLLASWDGNSAVLGPDPFDATAFSHHTPSVPVPHPDGAFIAFERPGDACSSGVSTLPLPVPAPPAPTVITTTRCDQALGWLAVD